MYIIDQSRTIGFKCNGNTVFVADLLEDSNDRWAIFAKDGINQDKYEGICIGYYDNEKRAQEVLCELLADLAAGDVTFARMPEA